MKTRNLIVLSLFLILSIFAALNLFPQYFSSLVNNENPLDINYSITDEPRQQLDVQNKDVQEHTSWLNPNEGTAYSDYGENTCGDNPYRKQLTVLFEKWKEIADELNITYVLTGGSLLGAWRHGDVIPFDEDIDIQIDEKDVPKLISVAHQRNPDTFYNGLVTSRLVVQDDWSLEDCNQRREFDCNGQLITEDIEAKTKEWDKCVFTGLTARLFDLDPSFKRVMLDIFHFKSHDGFIRCSCSNAKWSDGEMFPLKRCRFLGSSAWCPNNSGVVLRELYPKELLHPTMKCVEGEWIEVQRADLMKTISKKCVEFVRTEVIRKNSRGPRG